MFTVELKIVYQLFHHIHGKIIMEALPLTFYSELADMLDPPSLISTKFETNMRMQEGLKTLLIKKPKSI